MEKEKRKRKRKEKEKEKKMNESKEDILCIGRKWAKLASFHSVRSNLMTFTTGVRLADLSLFAESYSNLVLGKVQVLVLYSYL